MDFVKLWPTLLILAGNLVDAYADVISAWIAGHPKVTLVATGVLTLVANIVKSPVRPT